MQLARAFALAMALCAAHSAIAGSVVAKDGSVAAVQKVVQMLQDIQAKAKAEKQAEEVSFATFTQWCNDHQASLSGQVQQGKAEVESLTAEVGKLRSDAEALGREVGTLQADVTRYEGEAKSHTEQRAKDHEAFLAEQQDYEESVDALSRAIVVLQKQSADRPALLQLAESQQLPAQARELVAAFVGMLGSSAQPDFASRSAPQADAYEFQSSGLIDMLTRLKEEFTSKLAEAQKEEANSRHAFDMVKQDLTDTAERAKEDASALSGTKSQKEEQAALLQRELDSTASVLAADERTLTDTKVECSEKTASFQEKQQLRTEEIEAIQQAVDILSSEAVQTATDKHLALRQISKRAAVLLQMGLRGSASADSEGIRRRIRDFLKQESQRLHSQRLGLLVERLADDPFAKVKQLISDLITRLMEETHADTDHEGFCDKEMGVNKLNREQLTESIDRLTAEVDSGKATISLLTEDIAALTKAIAETDAAVAEATELRNSEKAHNAETVKEAEEAAQAVQAATTILKEFYKKASVATALIQVSDAPKAAWGTSSGVKMGTDQWDSLANPSFQGALDLGHKEGMQTFGATYVGRQSEAGGVLAMLEVIASDFATLKASTESAEALSAKAHQEFINQSTQDKAVKGQKLKLSSNDKAAAESKLIEDTKDLKFTEDKLLAANRYYEKLAPQCLDKGMTFEERTKAREAEIHSLKEALQILSGDDVAF